LAEIGGAEPEAAQTGVNSSNGLMFCATPPLVLAVHLLLLVSGQLAQHSSAAHSEFNVHLLFTGLSVSV